MADSKYVARLERLEGAFVHITDLLVLQGQRLDGFREELLVHRREMHDLRGEMHGLRDDLRGEMRAVREETRSMREALGDRLDRLIAITTKDRTMSIERLASIEARLARLEEHVGVEPQG
jgi:hypothetical protein